MVEFIKASLIAVGLVITGTVASNAAIFGHEAVLDDTRVDVTDCNAGNVNSFTANSSDWMMLFNRMSSSSGGGMVQGPAFTRSSLLNKGRQILLVSRYPTFPAVVTEAFRLCGDFSLVEMSTSAFAGLTVLRWRTSS